MRRRSSPVLLEPGVGRVDRAGKRLGAGATAAAEAVLRCGTAHPAKLLAVAPNDLEWFLADVAAVERRAQETARVDIPLHADRADVIARPTSVRRVDLR